MNVPVPTVQDHPQYPFRPGEAAAIRGSASSYLDAPDRGSWEELVLTASVALGRRFAFLERLIQGDVLFNLPLHTSAARDSSGDSPEAQGERLAGGERDLLDWETGAADELVSVLDGIGIKVLSPMQQAVDAACGSPDGSAPLFGAFSFEDGIGPALLVGRPLDEPVACYVLAHEFGHLVADFDPYQSRFCRWDPHSLRNLSDTPEERRADRFSRALLMPEGLFRSVLAEVQGSLQGRADPDADRCQADQLAAIFEVPAALVHLRIADLGLNGSAEEKHPREAAILPREPGGAVSRDHPLVHPAARQGDPVTISCLSLPERYVHLSLAAFSAAILKPDTLAEFLDTTQAEALRIVNWANLPVREGDRDS